MVRSVLADRFDLKAPIVLTAMAKGIASPEYVIACGKAGYLGSFGAGGLPPDAVRAGIQKIQREIDVFLVNLICSPGTNLERSCVDIFLELGVRFVEASAFLQMTHELVRYRASGLEEGPDGEVVIRNRIMAKLSRVEIATMFLSPAPPAILDRLVKKRDITPLQARLAARVPMCDYMNGEADSGGHTDRRAMTVLLPSLLRLRDRMKSQIPIGASGGIGDPVAMRGVMARGADFVGMGSVGQISRESGTCDTVRKMLSSAASTDVTMAISADMMELGVFLQVLKRGTFFAARANHLYELYRKYGGIDEIPAPERIKIEKKYFRNGLEQVWQDCVHYHERVMQNPEKIQKGRQNPKVKMEIIWKYYLGSSSRWANTGEGVGTPHSRAADFQIWTGPAIGSYNDWVRGSELDPAVSGRYPSIVEICDRFVDELNTPISAT